MSAKPGIVSVERKKEKFSSVFRLTAFDHNNCEITASLLLADSMVSKGIENISLHSRCNNGPAEVVVHARMALAFRTTVDAKEQKA